MKKLSLTRRHFLCGSAVSFFSLYTPPIFGKGSKSKGYLVAPVSQSLYTERGEGHSPDHSELRFFDLDSNQQFHIEIPVGLAHGAYPIPNSNRIIILETDGPGACIVDLKKRRVEKSFSAKEGWLFGGHATITPDGQHILTSEFPSTDWNGGAVMVRDLSNLNIIEEFSTGFSHPHDFAWTSDHKELLVAHYGKKLDFEPIDIAAPVVRINYKTKKVIAVHKSHLTSHRLCHIIATGTNSFMVAASRLTEKAGEQFDILRKVQLNYKELRKKGFFKAKTTNSLPSPAIYIDEHGKNHELWIPNHDKMRSNISLAHSRATGVTVMAHSGGSGISFWKGASLVSEFSLGEIIPLGLAASLDEKNFYLSTNKNGLYTFDAATGRLLNQIVCKDTFSSGSLHLYCVPKA